MPRKPDVLPDWFVGGRGKRLLFRALADGEVAGKVPPWSKAVLAGAAGVHKKHTVFRHLQVLVLAGLLIEESDGFRVNEDSTLIGPIRDFVDALDALEPRELPPSRGK